jgi:Rrf2 family protein
MRISKSFEQGIFVLLLLSTQQNHKPLKSSQLSALLNVSDSSLKKVLRKLVVAEMIESTATKDGGFTLKQAISAISLADVMHAMEGPTLVDYAPSHLAKTLFPDNEHTAKSEQLVFASLARSERAFSKELAHVTLDQLLEADSIPNGKIDWHQK